ncbi:NADH dehydrogenase [Naegleria gruberi]|uniref:NADH dehydrogenase n=1 Tax=Naegleria gruberi TaxID=5762 RepID=D2VG69_NAEGR|nr:NADH dehydrogenase [Naegleria gruberi]EFC44296.1 NADH dehydrogenase [Naegleria gruberi]|eukprot:XP_002677040.1 NADH dehydrogenase [Naegleria gruberi strain NEG-M]
MFSLQRTSRIVSSIVKNNNNLFPSVPLIRSFSSSSVSRSGGHGNSAYIHNTAEEESYKLDAASEQHWKMIDEHFAESIEGLDLDSLPPIEIDGETAVCNGFHSNGMGHPTEYIRINHTTPERCKYCGVRYIRKH